MLDDLLVETNYFSTQAGSKVRVSGSLWFWLNKRIFDLVLSVLLLPFLAILVVILSVLNPLFNKGPLFFVQDRMGRECLPFRAIKFRTMYYVKKIERKHDDPIEDDRITKLGRILRKVRIDELPQILNVLKGEMSLIGPRPDYFEHAKVFVKTVPGYEARHTVRPGISGLAQVSLGYAEGIDETRSKTSADLYYIEHANFWLDTRIVMKTIKTIVSRAGA